jgi:anti-anti-sigma factor
VTAVGERLEFSFTEHDESDGSVRVCLVGELDAGEAPRLQDALRRLEGEGSDVLLDVSGLTFMDLFGLHLIEEAADAARQGGFGFALAGPVPGAVRHVFVEAGAQHHLPGGQARLAAVPSGPNGDAGAAALHAVDRDRAAADRDQTRSDRDQTSADQDQTRSDRDQAAADADQRGSDRDQVAADDDQSAADRDEAASDSRGLPHEAGYDRNRKVRRRTARERDETTDTRARAGDTRDAIAAERDATAAERDATAAQRDIAAYGRDRLADVGDRSSSAEQAARRARGDRQRAQTNREQAAEDRDHAARDRQEAADERTPPGTPDPGAADADR